MSTSTPAYTLGSVTSEDGTTLGYRQLGNGPAVLLVPAGMSASQHYLRMATALADTFTVYVLDRRGRGLSGPHGEHYSMATECADIEALLTKSGARCMFGHSSSALIALQAALKLPALHKIAIYEPPLSLDGSISTAWIPIFDRYIAQGRPAEALVTFIKDDNLSRAPRWLLLPLLKMYIQREKRTLGPDDVPMEALIPTQRYDGLLVKEMNGSLKTFSQLPADVLLLGGAKSPTFLRESLDALNQTLPHVQRIKYPNLDHSGPNQDRPNQTGPERIAVDLRAFFGAS